MKYPYHPLKGQKSKGNVQLHFDTFLSWTSYLYIIHVSLEQLLPSPFAANFQRLQNPTHYPSTRFDPPLETFAFLHYLHLTLTLCPINPQLKGFGVDEEEAWAFPHLFQPGNDRKPLH